MFARTLSLVALAASAGGAAAFDLDEAPIRYASAKPDNVVTKLEAKLKDKAAALPWHDDLGYLPGLLKALDLPVSSQAFVFSRTSLQRSRIGPKTPRALYFNEDVTVGYCRKGDVLEVAANDPALGTVFYSVDQRADRTPKFTRQTESCLICHGSSANQGFPGHLARSVSPDGRGEPVLSRGTKRVDHSTPFEDRWGGWYVTGTSGRQGHLGNQIVGGWDWAGDKQPAGENVTDLKPYFTVANYLSPHSDVVALMVLEHQNELSNRITRANFLTRIAQHEQTEMNKSFDRPGEERWEGITRRIEHACEPVVQYLLFCDEAKLTEAVAGTSDFAKEFAARGPFDAKKRSLREFDLRTRLFKYPVSYLIYSKQFDGLPAEAKARIYRRLWEVLTGADTSKPFAHLTAEGRRAALDILRATKADLPEYWKE